MGVEQHHGRWDTAGGLQFTDSIFELCNSLLEQLGPCLSLSIVVLACVSFLGANALLASGLNTIALLLRSLASSNAG